MATNLVVKYATVKIRVPKSVVVGNFSASLQALDALGAPVGDPRVVTSQLAENIFTDVADGDYLVTSARVDAAGAAIGKSIQDAITIASGVVSVDQLVDSVAAVSYELTVDGASAAVA